MTITNKLSLPDKQHGHCGVEGECVWSDAIGAATLDHYLPDRRIHQQAAYILALFFCILWTLFVLPITLFCIIKFDLLLAFLGVLVGLPSWLLLIGNRRKTTWCYWPFMVINLLHLIFSVLFAFSIPLIALTETVAPLPKRQASYREPVFDSARTFPLFVYIVFELIFILLCYISYHVFMIVLYSYRYVEDYHHIIRRHKRKQSRISSKTVV